MSVIVAAYAAVAAGNLLLKLTGAGELPGYLDLGIDAWERIATMRRPGRENRKRAGEIQGRLAHREYAAADAGDVEAADLAVARVLSCVPACDQLISAVRDPQELHALLASQATAEEEKLLSESAQAVFRLLLSASESYVVTTALDSEDFVKLAHRAELRDLVELAGQVRTLGDRIERVPAETVSLLAGEVLMLQPTVTPKGRTIEPSRLLAPTSGVFPFVDPHGLLDGLQEWADDPRAFGITVVGGVGGAGKSRLAVELCRRLVARGSFWLCGFLGSKDVETAVAALSSQPGGRLIVIDYAETRTGDVARVLTSLVASATFMEPVRVLLLVRTPALGAVRVVVGHDDAEAWVGAVRPSRDEAVNQLLDEADCLVLGSAAFTHTDRVEMFTRSVRHLGAFVGADSVAVEQIDPSFLAHPDFSQPLAVAMAAYMAAHGQHTTEANLAGLYEGVLEHEAVYWQANDKLPWVRLGLTEPEHRLLVAVATLTDAVDDNDARKLLHAVDFLRGEANARTVERALRWLPGPLSHHRRKRVGTVGARSPRGILGRRRVDTEYRHPHGCPANGTLTSRLGPHIQTVGARHRQPRGSCLQGG